MVLWHRSVQEPALSNGRRGLAVAGPVQRGVSRREAFGSAAAGLGPSRIRGCKRKGGPAGGIGDGIRWD